MISYFLKVTALLIVLGSANAKDWPAIEQEMLVIGDRVMSLFILVGNAISNENSVVWERIKPKLEEYQGRAVPIINEYEKATAEETLTVDQLDEYMTKIGEVFASLKAALDDDLKELSDGLREKIGHICQNAKAILHRNEEKVKDLLQA